MQIINVKVKNIELCSSPANAIEHQHIVRNWINDARIEA